MDSRWSVSQLECHLILEIGPDLGLDLGTNNLELDLDSEIESTLISRSKVTISKPRRTPTSAQISVVTKFIQLSCSYWLDILPFSCF